MTASGTVLRSKKRRGLKISLRRKPRVLKPKKPFSREKTSTLLERIARDGDGDGMITLQDVINGLGDRSFAIVLLVFAAAGALPGIAWVASLPLMIVSVQLMLGQDQPWLPKWVGRQAMTRARLASLLRHVAKVLRPLEKLSRPRWAIMHSDGVHRVLAVMIVLLALVVILPIAGFNAPASLAIAVIALGFLEQDGILSALGFAAGFITLVVLYEIADLALRFIMDGWHWILDGF